MARIDLDARLAAIAEAGGDEPLTLALRGHEFELPRKRAVLEFSEAFEQGEENPAVLARMVRILFGGEQYAVLRDMHLDDKELMVLLEGVNELYGVSVPESVASNGSRGSTGNRSRQTSKPPTASS